MTLSLSDLVKSWTRPLLVASCVAFTGCGAGVEEPSVPGAHEQSSTRNAAEYAEGDCDGPNDCPVSSSLIDCGPGQPYAYAWRTNDGGYCIERDACGPNGLACPIW
ncbi:hypothetical protein F0U61_26700 [Archangium violaceum]|uniref:hypothetical protein n=1 Tax=Archangium violaceum TaxID=83451 RepID=UPI002B2ACBE5|nr:hypothetical protein F0U61_26700 [Archangium violaceum]